MVDYFVPHPHVTTGKFKTLHGYKDLKGSWEELTDMLNAKFPSGKSKAIESWKTTWRDNKTKVSTKFVALKKKRAATGNDPVDIKLTERDKKIIGLLGYDYMEGLETVPDSFPEEYSTANEKLAEGDQFMLEVAPKTITVRPSLATVQPHNTEPSTSIPIFIAEEIIDPLVFPFDDNIGQLLHDFDESDQGPSGSRSNSAGPTPNIAPSESIHTDPSHSDSITASASRKSSNTNSEHQLVPNAGIGKLTPRRQSGTNIIAGKENRSNPIIKRSAPPTSRFQILKRGMHPQRLGDQLQDARIEFGDLAQRTCEATELIAHAEMKRAEAAVIMANNDQARVEILKTMAENDKARNEVLIRLVGTLDLILSNTSK